MCQYYLHPHKGCLCCDIETINNKINYQALSGLTVNKQTDRLSVQNGENMISYAGNNSTKGDSEEATLCATL